MLIRIGPGIFELGKVSLNHLYDGFSVMHQFSIAKGRATYKNSALKSEVYLASKAANRLTFSQFGMLVSWSSKEFHAEQFDCIGTLADPDPSKRFLAG